jgi:excisionase family DNA binding protein
MRKLVWTEELNDPRVAEVRANNILIAREGIDVNANANALEPYVSPEEAAGFLKTNRLNVIRMARSGSVPAYPLGAGKRRQWRFKLSELDKYMQRELNTAHPPVRQRKGE